MVLKIVYFASKEELDERNERREIEKRFNARSDHLLSEEEKNYCNRKINHLKIDGGKIYERNESRITQLVIKNTKSF